MHQSKFRATVAAHFHALTQIPRHEIFGLKAGTVMPVCLPDDANTMFAGFVGPKYVQGQGLIILTINSNDNGDAYTQMNPENDFFYSLLHEFKAARGSAIEPAFEEVNRAYIRIVKDWSSLLAFGPVLDLIGLEIENIAYISVAPYRSRTDKAPSAASCRTAWSRVVEPTLQLLKPRAVLSLGDKAGSVVKPLIADRKKYHCLPRITGDSYLSEDTKMSLLTLRRSFL